MFAQLIGPEIKTLIKERNFAALKECFCEWPPADIAELVAELPPEDQVIVFRLLPRAVAALTFEYLDLPIQRELLRGMGREDVAGLLNEMSPDDRTMLLEELPNTAITELLKLLSPDELKVAKTLLGYPENSVGRLMTVDFVAVRDDWTVQRVLDHIREHGKDRETLNVIYVVDESGRLIDDVRIREFLLRPLNTKVRDLRDDTFVALNATDIKSDVVAVFKRYDRTALPVVDSAGKLVGIVTIDDVLDVVEQEATVDIQKIGGSEALDEPYSTISFPRMIKKRAGWLIILFLGEMLTATAMGYFENEIEKAVVLALFLPLIISSGGNSGSQASTLIIRAMALGEVKLKDWWRVMRRELYAGATLGAILGTIGFLRIAIWSAFSNVYGPYWFLVALTVGIALIGVVLWGTFSGSMLPLALRKCRIDPATSSAPFVATLVDVTGLIIYFSIAMLVLRTTLLAAPDKDILKLGQEKTVLALNHLLELPKTWETEEAELNLAQRKLTITLKEADDIEKQLKCPRCGGKFDVKGHDPVHRDPYLKVFKFDSELVSAAPILQCRKCGLLQTNSVPLSVGPVTP
jgi:magnesium transporter